jgi:hypothetical protein
MCDACDAKPESAISHPVRPYLVVGTSQHDVNFRLCCSRNAMMSLLRKNLTWRSWRVLGVSGSSSTCIRPRQHLVWHHQHTRLLGTRNGAGSEGNAASSNVFALALGSVVLGLGGYYVGARSNRRDSPSKPVYGTPEEFARAIEELKSLFSDESVTTHEDQLKAHGFSPNTHLPGTVFALSLAS